MPDADGYGTLQGSYRLRLYDQTLPEVVSGSDLGETRYSLEAIGEIKYAVPVHANATKPTLRVRQDGTDSDGQ